MTGHILEQRGVSSFIRQRIMGWILVVIHFYDYRRVGMHVFFLLMQLSSVIQSMLVTQFGIW